jgi:hypothetical protein
MTRLLLQTNTIDSIPVLTIAPDHVERCPAGFFIAGFGGGKGESYEKHISGSLVGGWIGIRGAAQQLPGNAEPTRVPGERNHGTAEACGHGFYILYQSVLIYLGYFVVQWPLPALLKWLIIAPTSFIIIVAPYEFLLRRVSALRFLFGMKPLPKTIVLPLVDRRAH